VVEAKCWPAYSEGRFKKLTLSNLNKNLGESSEHHSSKTISLRSIGLKGEVGMRRSWVWWDIEIAEAEQLKNKLKLHELLHSSRSYKS